MPAPMAEPAPVRMPCAKAPASRPDHPVGVSALTAAVTACVVGSIDKDHFCALVEK
jgi:hypothetical protein